MEARFVAAILAVVAPAVISGSFAAELDQMGGALPAAPATAAAPGMPTAWEGVALDGLPDKVIGNALGRPLADQGRLTTRGAKEIVIYRAAAPSVVLIITRDDALGSGSYIGHGLVLTNWHVVGSNRVVGVLFKPGDDRPIDLKGLVRADVVKTDPQRDLALIRLAVVPPALKPLELGNRGDIVIGADVHAIGHPIGESWTYTKGLISQVRRDYTWKNKGETISHHATVIQTQTPISPGNSGGPLLGDSGKILGVNSFSAKEGENVNYAIAVDDIAAFIGAASEAPPPRPSTVTSAGDPKACKPVMLYDGRNRENNAQLIQIDTNCDRIADVSIVTPDDKKQPIRALIDSNYDGKIDIIVEDIDRDGKWDFSYHDVDFDGWIDLVGFHPDGKIVPSRYERFTGFLTTSR